jgi:hypothetical protein
VRNGHVPDVGIVVTRLAMEDPSSRIVPDLKRVPIDPARHHDWTAARTSGSLAVIRIGGEDVPSFVNIPEPRHN